MANYVESFASKLDWAMPFQRTGKFPLDRTDLFASYADAVKYAAGNTADPDTRALCGTSYVGQIITVFEDDVVTVYKINADRTLEQVGKATASDDKSIVLVDGVLKLKGFQEVITAGNFQGMQPRINATGELEWYKPDTSTVEGLQAAVGALQKTVDGDDTTTGLVAKVANNAGAIEELKTGKVDVVEGKQLSTNDYTTAEKEKLAAIAPGAEVNVQADWAETDESSDAFILNKPTKLSAFENDGNFIDNTVDNLTNYYTKTQTYTQTEVNELIGALHTIQIQVVEELPETGESNNIYLRANSGSGNNSYDEYLWITTGTGAPRFELIGTTEVDLSNYLTKTGDGSALTVTPSTDRTTEFPADGSDLAHYVGYIKQRDALLKPVATSGSYNDLEDKPTLVGKIALTLSAATGSTVSTDAGALTGKSLLGVECTLASTGEHVMIDYKVVAGTLTATVGNGLGTTDTINIVVSYL